MSLFDRFPNEILFLIFDYLSNNDILYTFFHFNNRFNSLLLQNKRFSNYFELPDTNLNHWKSILSILGPQIECLNLNTIDLSFPLKYFPNLQSIILSLPYSLLDNELNLILESTQFPHLRSFKIEEKKFSSNQLPYKRLTNPYPILEKIFNGQNCLEIFDYSLPTSPFVSLNLNHFQIHPYLHSLTLTTTFFEASIKLIEYTPNLIYLNIQSHLWGIPIILKENMNIKLKEFYLTLSMTDERQVSCDGVRNTIRRFSTIIDLIKHFSSSLNCLSLNFARLNIQPVDDFALNSDRFKQFLESMVELKQFYYYGRLFRGPMDNQMILSHFQNSYWLNQPWGLFGMHRNYFYTLPFHFDHLYEFSEGFDNVKSNNPQILITNPRIWSYVKSIELPIQSNIDIRQLKIKMPKLNSIKFSDLRPWCTDQRTDLIQIHGSDLRLDHVRSIQFTSGPIEYKKEWIMYSLPNLRDLSSTSLPPIENPISRRFNKTIQRLDINYNYIIKQLIERDGNYFSNVQYLNICLDDLGTNSQLTAEMITKVFKKFPNLKVLLLYIRLTRWDGAVLHGINIKQILEYLNQTEILKTYQIKSFSECCLFYKQEYEEFSYWKSLLTMWRNIFH